jgi:hypothetical protein
MAESGLYQASESDNFQMAYRDHFHQVLFDDGLVTPMITIYLPYKRNLLTRSGLWFFIIRQSLEGNTLRFECVDPAAAINTTAGPTARYNFACDGGMHLLVVALPGLDQGSFSNRYVIKSFGHRDLSFLSEPVNHDIVVTESPMNTYTFSVGAKATGANSLVINKTAIDAANTATGRTDYGAGAGAAGQGIDGIAVGRAAGAANQGAGAIAIGAGAGASGQGANTVAIGNGAGATASSADEIMIGRACAPASVAGRLSFGAHMEAVGAGAAFPANYTAKIPISYNGVAYFLPTLANP